MLDSYLSTFILGTLSINILATLICFLQETNAIYVSGIHTIIMVNAILLAHRGLFPRIIIASLANKINTGMDSHVLHAPMARPGVQHLILASALLAYIGTVSRASVAKMDRYGTIRLDPALIVKFLDIGIPKLLLVTVIKIVFGMVLIVCSVLNKDGIMEITNVFVRETISIGADFSAFFAQLGKYIIQLRRDVPVHLIIN